MSAQTNDDRVKSSFLPKFARYVEWPAAVRPAAGQPFQLCIIGRDPFGPLLDRAAAQELIDGHSVTVRRLSAPDEAGGCHVAFVAGALPTETDRLLLALRSLPILTITDDSGALERGMIHFATVSGRVRFFIDQASATQRGLTISSRLLALAAGVRQRR